MKRILEKKSLQNKLNRFFIQRLGGIIVEGNVQYNMFSKLISDDKIHIIPNFAEDYLFVDETEIEKKFCTMKPINVLYLSNLISGKGYNELVDAYINLNEELKKNIKIIFVGGFESEKDKRIFFNKIHPLKGVFYEGTFVSGIEKKLLYLRSHIFCLPSYYPFEGQPISILEAYATGCVVITTNHSGIPDIFTDGINGFEVEKMSSSSLSNVLQQIITNPQQLLPIATYNRRIAFEKYRTCIYLNSIKHVFNEIVSFKNINRKLI